MGRDDLGSPGVKIPKMSLTLKAYLCSISRINLDTSGPPGLTGLLWQLPLQKFGRLLKESLRQNICRVPRFLFDYRRTRTRFGSVKELLRQNIFRVLRFLFDYRRTRTTQYLELWPGYSPNLCLVFFRSRVEPCLYK